jgi:hypothetical protein
MPTGNQIPKHWQARKFGEICELNPKILVINEYSEVQFFTNEIC